MSQILCEHVLFTGVSLYLQHVQNCAAQPVSLILKFKIKVKVDFFWVASDPAHPGNLVYPSRGNMVARGWMTDKWLRARQSKMLSWLMAWMPDGQMAK